jgi:glycosyltransferase involved in cell wall biosynthesis
MHVLVTSDAVGGVWTYTRELVSGLTRRGHRVTLVSFGQLPQQHQLSWMRGLQGLRYYPTDFPLEWMPDAEDGIAASVDYLEELINVARPDILHSNQFRYGALTCGIPTIVVAHSDVLSWSAEVQGTSTFPAPWLNWYQDLVSEGLADADMVVAPSQWMLDAIARHYALPSGATVIHNGRDAALFKTSSRKQPCVLSVGRLWDQGKQIGLLLARPQCAPVHIVGANEHPDAHEATGTRLDTAGNSVRWMGPRSEDELRALYADSGIYAITSRYEPFGLAPVEAAFSHCALVANDIPVFHELWGDSAIYFRRNDPDALADAIRLVNDNVELRDEYADRSWRRALARFDAQRMISQYETLYGELSSKGAAA